jgi:chromosome segregation ATPase
MMPAAVTLDGTVIHKSGLITGGRSSQSNSKKWEEKDVQGMWSLQRSIPTCLLTSPQAFSAFGITS